MRVEIQPELWVSDTAAAVSYYQQAFGAAVEHRVGDADDSDGVAQLSINGARFWIAGCSSSMGRLDPALLRGATARFLLVVEDPHEVTRSAIDAGATPVSTVIEEHGWLVGRIVDPFGHEWEIGRPLGTWPRIRRDLAATFPSAPWPPSWPPRYVRPESSSRHAPCRRPPFRPRETAAGSLPSSASSSCASPVARSTISFPSWFGSRGRSYLRALATVPNLTIHYGRFMTRAATRRCVKDRRGQPTYTDVWITEEKGSDVNLASHLLIDGFRARYDLAVVISNDSDLKEPIHFVRHDLKAPVGVLNPHRHSSRSWALSPKDLPRGSFYKPIRRAVLRACQFPDSVPDARGIVNKPLDWYPAKQLLIAKAARRRPRISAAEANGGGSNKNRSRAKGRQGPRRDR